MSCHNVESVKRKYHLRYALTMVAFFDYVYQMIFLVLEKGRGTKKTPLYVMVLLNWALRRDTVRLGLLNPIYIISINWAVSNCLIL